MPPPIPHAAATPQPSWWSRNWKWIVPLIVVCVVGFVGVIVGIVMLVFGAMKSSDAYKGAVARAHADARVVEALGNPMEEGILFTGNINVSSDSGHAEFSIPISGPKGKGELEAVADKSGGVWNYTTLVVEMDGGKKIDLLTPEGAASPPAAASPAQSPR